MLDKLRSFQANWFQRFPWLHHDNDTDSAFCFPCIKALSVGAISSNDVEQAFVKTGFENRKKTL